MMSRRRSTRLSSALDASFQIPLAVNNTANNLLLEDDALEHDFFDGFDYTLATPVPMKASADPISHQTIPETTHSDQENVDCSYDYAQEEREVALGDTITDDETPRGKRTVEMAGLELSPTPRAHKNKGDRTDLVASLHLPASICSSPVVNEYHLKRRKGNDTRSSPLRDLPRNPTTSTITPKSKQRRESISEAPLPIKSSSIAAAPPSFVSRTSKVQLHEQSREEDANMVQHERDPSASIHIGILSDQVPAMDMPVVQTTPVSVSLLHRNPRSPERTLSKPMEIFQRKSPRASGRRRSRSSTQSTRPTPVSRTRHDVFMLPIQEEDEDVEDRLDGTLVLKTGNDFDSASSVEPTVDKTNVMALKIIDQQLVEPASSSLPTASNSGSKSKVASLETSVAKRRDDTLASQSAPKKRTTGVTDYPSMTSTEDNPARTSLGYYGTTVPSRCNELRRVPKSGCGRATSGVISPTAVPSAPESSSSSSRVLYPQPGPDSVPIHDLGQAPPESSQETDEVQNFLSRYAKKYGSTVDGTVANFSSIPVQPTPVVSEQGGFRVDPTITERSDPVPKPRPDIRSIKSAKTINRHAVADRISNGKIISKNLSPKKSSRQETTDKLGSSKPLITSDTEKRSSAVTDSRSKDQRRTTSQASDARSVQVIAQASLQDSALNTPEAVLPTTSQSPIIILSGRTAENELARISEQPSRSRDKICKPHALNVPFRRPVDPVETVPSRRSTTSESKITEANTEPANTRLETVTGLTQCNSRTLTDRRSSKQPIQPVRAKQTRSSRPTDDMFARKKRDSYLQKGIDLTAHSSHRYEQKWDTAAGTHTKSFDASSQEPPKQEEQANTNHPSVKPFDYPNAVSTSDLRSVTTALGLTSDAEDQKNKDQEALDVECRDQPEDQKQRDTEIRDKQVVRASHQRRGDSGQKRDSDMPEPTRPRRKLKYDTEEDAAYTTGAGMIERLAGFSQKVVDSFGLLSSHDDVSVTERQVDETISHNPTLQHGSEVTERVLGSDMRQETCTMVATPLSPRQIGRSEAGKCDPDRSSRASSDRLTSERRSSAGKTRLEGGNFILPGGSNFSYGIATDHASSTIDAQRNSRKSQKRLPSAEPEDVATNNDVELLSSERSCKRTKVSQDKGYLGAGVEGVSSPSEAARSRGPISKPVIGTRTSMRSSSARKNTRALTVRSTAHSAGVTSLDDMSSGARKGGPVNNLRGLTVPVAPAFATDIMCQQRALAKAERQPKVHEKDGQKTEITKSDDTSAECCAKSETSEGSAQACEPRQQIVPGPFRFETDIRGASRRQEFEAKLKAWEERASRESSLKGKLPDFKSRHAAQEASLAALATQRHQRIKPTIPSSPRFVLKTRLAERHKFEETLRAKEAEAERIREEQRRMREEEEEEMWREARKRAIPRANAVPEWYAHAPKRTT